jgi:hypothetical protein
LAKSCVISTVSSSLMAGVGAGRSTAGPILRIPAASTRNASILSAPDALDQDASDDESTSSGDDDSDDRQQKTSEDEDIQDDDMPVLLSPPTTVPKKRKRRGHNGAIRIRSYMHICDL